MNNIDCSALVTLTQARARAIADCIDAGRVGRAMQSLVGLDAADVAGVFNELTPVHREKLVGHAIKALDPDFLLDLDEEVRDELLNKITVVALAEALAHMDTKDAISIIEDMTADQQKALLGSLNTEARNMIETGLNCPEDSAGRILDDKYLAVPANWTVRKALSVFGPRYELRCTHIVLLDKNSKPESALHLSVFLQNIKNLDAELQDLQTDELYLVPSHTDREEVVFLFLRYKLIIAAVIDDAGRLLGILTPDSILQVEREEAEEDMMRFTGTSDSVSTSIFGAAFGRLNWLIHTVGLTVISSSLLLYCKDYFESHRELFFLYPAIAAICGAALTQTVGVVVRSLANRQLSVRNIGKLMRRESAIGLINGCIFGAFLALRCLFIGGSYMSAFVAGLTLCIVMFFSSFVGVVVPFMLDRVGVDPATAAGSVLGAIADIATVLCIFGLIYLGTSVFI